MKSGSQTRQVRGQAPLLTEPSLGPWVFALKSSSLNCHTNPGAVYPRFVDEWVHALLFPTPSMTSTGPRFSWALLHGNFNKRKLSWSIVCNKNSPNSKNIDLVLILRCDLSAHRSTVLEPNPVFGKEVQNPPAVNYPGLIQFSQQE